MRVAKCGFVLKVAAFVSNAPTPSPSHAHPVLVRIVEFLGSLRLAMLLLAVVIVACAVGTVAESRFDARVARYYVYDAHWFSAWLVVLATNLLVSALLRWPWRRRHVGFLTVHLGIIVLLAGAMIGKVGGYEGTITLSADGPADNVLQTRETVLQVGLPGRPYVDQHDFPIEMRPPSGDRAFVVDLPGDAGRIVADGTRLDARGRRSVRLSHESASGVRGEPRWLAEGEPLRLPAPAGELYLCISNKRLRLPVSVKLEAFEVGYEEGSSQPASFRSRLGFIAADGTVTHGACSMNNPALWPDAMSGHFTGLCHKFSQASWDPSNLRLSTVQVLYDPGWMPKWVGSLIVVVGLCITFLQKSGHGRVEALADASADADTDAADT